MEFIKKSSWTGEEWYESKDERYLITEDDQNCFTVKYLGAVVSIQGTLQWAKDFIRLVEEANYFKEIYYLDRKESRKLLESGLKKMDRKEYSTKWARIGYVQEAYHDVTIYKNIDTKELRYDSYYIGD